MKLYSSNLKHLRKELRKDDSPYEQVIWDSIRSKKLGVKFRRQVSIGGFIVDFCCLSLRLIIEIDGAEHFTPVGIKNDANRDEILTKGGYTILRFENQEVYARLESVLEEIKIVIEELS